MRADLIKNLIGSRAAKLAAKGVHGSQRVDVGPDRDRHQLGPAAHQLVRHLGKRVVELGANVTLIVGGGTPIANVADDADDAAGIGPEADPEVLTDGVAAWKCLLGQHVVDDGDGLGAHAVLIGRGIARGEARCPSPSR